MTAKEEPPTTAQLARRVVEHHPEVFFEVAFIALATERYVDAVGRFERIPDGKFHDAARADMGRAWAEIRVGLEAWQKKAWPPKKAAGPAEEERAVNKKSYDLWDRRRRRWVRVFGDTEPMSLEEVAAYVRGGTSGRHGPDIVRYWELREVSPVLRTLHHTGEDLLALAALLNLSGDRPALDAALSAWARAHAPVAPKKAAGPA